MLAVTLKQLVANRLRLALTVVAVVLGVTFVSGSLVLTDTSQRLFDEQFATATAGADLTVRSAAAFDSAMGVEVDRDPVPRDVVERITGLSGVDSTYPVAEGRVLLEHDGTPVSAGQVLLTSWVPESVGPYELRNGRAPEAAGEIVIDAATARNAGIGVGDTVTITGNDSTGFEIVGLAGFGNAEGVPGSSIAITTLGAAQAALGLTEDVTKIVIVTAGSVLDVQKSLGRTVGQDFEVVTAADLAAAGADAAKGSVEYLQVMLLALAVASLLIGAFLIANTFSIVVSQRTRELAVLRAAGATGGQVMRSVLAEALLVGVLASAVGTALGVAAAIGLREVAAVFGITLPEGDVVLTPRTVVVALAVGILVTVMSALAPARRAGEVSPIAAMRETATGFRASRPRTASGAIVTGMGVAALIAVSVGAPVAAVGAGAVLTVVGVGILGPVLVPTLIRGLGRPLAMTGVPGRLAVDSAAAAPRRTASTSMALALGLTLILFITVVASSVKTSIRDTYREVVSADLMVESTGGEMLGGLPMQVHHHVTELDSVAVASRMQYGHWKDGGITSALTAIDPATINEVTSVDMVAGSLADLAGGGIVLAEQVAEDRGLRVGDSLAMTFSRVGERRLEVAGLIDDGDAQALATNYIVSLDTYAELFAETMDATVFVTVADGVDVPEAASEIEDVLAEFPMVSVRDQAAAMAARTGAVDQILGLQTVLLLLAITIALLGITNTLALSVIERTREIGLLRSVGMIRTQVARMVRGEALMVAVLAVVIGVVLGTSFGAVTVAALSQAAPVTPEFPIDRMLLLVLLTAGAGVLAGVLPARRASRLEVLDAARSE